MTKKYVVPPDSDLPPEVEEQFKKQRKDTQRFLRIPPAQHATPPDPADIEDLARRAKQLRDLRHVPEAVRSAILGEKLGKLGEDTVTQPPDPFGYRPGAIYGLERDRLLRLNPHPALGDEKMERVPKNPSAPEDWLKNRRRYPRLYPGLAHPISGKLRDFHHPSLEELMRSDESLKRMTDQERERWIARTRPTKEGVDYHTLDIWNRAILSRPHINRHSKPPGTGFHRQYVRLDGIPARVITKTRSG